MLNKMKLTWDQKSFCGELETKTNKNNYLIWFLARVERKISSCQNSDISIKKKHFDIVLALQQKLFHQGSAV